MKIENLKYLAQTGTAEDVENLLKNFGSAQWAGPEQIWDGWKWAVPKGNCIDWIVSGISEDNATARRAQKQSLVAQYGAGTGPFKKGQDVSPDVLQEFRDTIAELTAQVSTIPELTKQVRLLTEAVEKQSPKRRTATQKPAQP